MTVEEVYTTGISELPESISDNPDLESYAVLWVNLMLQECFHIENSIRRFNGEELLTEATTVDDNDDELTYNSETNPTGYHDELVRVAFPYGIASRAFIDDDNDYRANIFRQLYQARANECMKYYKQQITDVY